MEFAHNHSHSIDHDHGKPYPTRRKFVYLLLAAGGFGRWALGQTKNPISIAEGFRRWNSLAENLSAGIALIAPGGRFIKAADAFKRSR